MPQSQANTAVLFSVTDRQGLKYTPSTLSQNQFTQAGWDIVDSHGNRITTTDSGWTDSVGRTIPGTWIAGLPEDDPVPGIPTTDLSLCDASTSSARIWTVPGKSEPYTFCYTNLSGKTAFNVTSVLGSPSGGVENSWNTPLLTQIVLPNQTSYRFSYDTQFAELQKITFPTGGYVQYSWQTVFIDCSLTDPAKRVVSSRTVYDGSQQAIWSYTWALKSWCSASQSNDVLIQKPDGSDEWHSSFFNPGALNPAQDTVKYFQGRTTGDATAPQGTMIRQVVTKHAVFQSTLVQPSVGPEYFIGPVTSTVTTLDDGSVTETDSTLVPNGGTVTFNDPSVNVPYEYPQGQSRQCSCINYPEIQSTSVYDYGQGSPGGLFRTVTTNFAFTGDASNLIDLPSNTTMTSGTGATSAKTTYTYDESAYSPGNRQGDLTSVSKSVNSTDVVTTHTSYNSSGMPVTMTDARGTPTTISSYQCSGLFPQQVSIANGTSAQQNRSYGYDCATGNITSFTDPNGQSTTYQYSDTLSRLTHVGYPDNGAYDVSYIDGTNSSITLTTATDGQQGPLTQTVSYDGLGRTTSAATAGGATVSTLYDLMGRVAATSNPFNSGSASAWTSFAYDALGRRSLQCNPDSGSAPGACVANSASASYQEWDYSGPAVTQYDEKRNAWQRRSDALGRLTSVVENPYASRGGTTCGYICSLNVSTTNYAYDSLDNLIAVNQLGSGGEFARSRSFTYDELSRLITAANPESGTVCYGQFVQSVCSSGYDPNGNLLSKTDARGAVTSYQYDALNRVTRKLYNGVENAHYTYDGTFPSGIPGQTLSGPDPHQKGRLSYMWTTTQVGAGAEDQYFGYDPMGRLKTWAEAAPSELGVTAHGISANYDLAGNLHMVTYPNALLQITNGYDSAGRLNSVTSGADSYYSVTDFYPDGSPRAITYGNGVVETLSENGRLQTCEDQVALGSTAYLDRQYFFGTDNTPGQQCISAPSNNGNILAIGDGLDPTHSQNFSYDVLNRLKFWTAANMAGGYRQKYFNYDSFGNMIQSDSSAPVSASPYNVNNQLPSSSFNCQGIYGNSAGYDAAGNVTCTGTQNQDAKAYVWDTEERLIQTWGQQNNNTYYPLAVYSYDAEGKRIRSDQFAFGSYNIQGWREYSYFNGQMLAEHDNAGVWTDYIYANGRKIASRPSSEGEVRFSGTAQNGTFFRYLVAQPYNGQLIQSGDTLVVRQRQTGSAGGTIAVMSPQAHSGDIRDQDGQLGQEDRLMDTWHSRRIDLSSMAGQTLSGVVVGGNFFFGTGPYTIEYAEIAIVHQNGDVWTLYNRGDSFGMTSASGFAPDSAGLATSPADQTSTHFFVGDQVGTTQLELGWGGSPVWKGEFGPFGAELDTQATTNRYKFTGKERDAESGLDYFGARYYGSSMGALHVS